MGLKPDLIWVTGLSSAGKTVVAEAVVTLLRSRGLPTIWLDGDSLREIFQSGVAFEREDRIRLAGVYFRLCYLLVNQGLTVVISSIAMYSEVVAWIRENFNQSFIVLLEVPEHERIRRDGLTGKGVYKSGQDFSVIYDEVNDFDVRYPNYGENSAAEAAKVVVGAIFGSDLGPPW